MSDFSFPTQELTARKQHKCTWCGQPIMKGERYWRWCSISEGTYATTSKMHPECREACQKDAREFGQDDGYMPYENQRGGPPP
jgi:hypothetical protein